MHTRPSPTPTQFNSLDECVNIANGERVAPALVQRHPDQRRVRVVWPAGQTGAPAVSASFLERYCPRPVGQRMRTGFQGSSSSSSSSGGETVCLSLHRPSRVGRCCSLALDVGASRSDVPRRDKKFRKPISLRYRGTRHSFTVRSHDSRVWSMMQRYCVCAQELMLYIDVLFVIKADS